MKRTILIVVLLLCLGGGRVAVGQETNSNAAPAHVSLETLLMQKNIFDPTRTGRRTTRTGPRFVPPPVRTFTFRGTLGDDAAIFTGSGAGDDALKVGRSINGFKVMKIPRSYDDAIVKLADPSGKIINLKDGESMRREGDGPWQKSNQSADDSVAITETKADASSASSTAVPAAVSDIIKLLRQRKQEEK